MSKALLVASVIVLAFAAITLAPGPGWAVAGLVALAGFVVVTDRGAT
jgi:hypothetical protein